MRAANQVGGVVKFSRKKWWSTGGNFAVIWGGIGEKEGTAVADVVTEGMGAEYSGFLLKDGRGL